MQETRIGGLSVMVEGASEQSVERALKQFDPDLRLIWQPCRGQRLWRVYKYLGSSRDAEWICDWEHQGEPLPLSHGLVDRVKNLHLDSRAPRIDVERENDERRRRAVADWEAEVDEAARDLVLRLRGRVAHALPRGVYRRNTQFKDISR